MQLQQSGYRLCRAILSRIPKPVLLFAVFLAIALMVGNTFLALSSKPQLNLKQCLLKYYDLTHSNISVILDDEVAKRQLSDFQFYDASSIVKYLNESRIVEFHSSQAVGQECRIELNYQAGNNSGAIGYLLSNYPLFSVNRTNQEFIRKHGIIVDRILLPDINVGYRYFGVDLFVAKVEDFVLALLDGFPDFEARLRKRFVQHFLDLNAQLKELENEEKQKQGGNDIKTANNSRRSSEEGQAGNKMEKKTQESVKMQNSDNQLAITTMLQQASRRTEGQGETNATIEEGQSDNNTNSTSETEVLKMKKSILQNIITNLVFKTSYSKHKIIYSFDAAESIQQWHSVILPSNLEARGYFTFWNLIGKLFTLSFMTLYVIFCFYLIAIAVRYAFILILIVTSVLFNCCARVGWMDRFLNIYRGPDPNPRGRKNIKTIIQIMLSFLGIYLLFTVIGYLLSESAGVVLKVTQVIPNHPLYSSKLLRIFYLVEISHYIFLRTRISLQFFSKFSLIFTILILMVISLYPYFYTSFLLNLLLLFNLLLIFCFLFFEKWICQEDLQSGFKPCLEKPRMLFYLGYDLDWHRGLPPVWTMFQPWFDLSYASEQERSYIDQNYELLYGRLMGVNEPQELPDDQDENQESAAFGREILENSD